MISTPANIAQSAPIATNVSSFPDELSGTWFLPTQSGFRFYFTKLNERTYVITGNTGCNQFRMEAQAVERDQIQFSIASTTKVHCPGELTHILDSLSGKKLYISFPVNGLLLKNDTTHLLLHSELVSVDISQLENSTWSLSEVVVAGKTSVFPIDFQSTLSFHGNSTITGTSTCNTYTSEISVGTEDTFRVGPISSTERYCEESSQNPSMDITQFLKYQDFTYELAQLHREKWSSRQLSLKSPKHKLILIEHKQGELKYSDLEGGYYYLQLGVDQLTVVQELGDANSGDLVTMIGLRPQPGSVVGFWPGPYVDLGTFRLEPQIVYGRPIIEQSRVIISQIRPSEEITGWVYKEEENLLRNELASLIQRDKNFGENWLEVARHEHASIASFGKLLVELCVLGAPGPLLVKVLDAARDEVDHTRLALTLAKATNPPSTNPRDYLCALPDLPLTLDIREIDELKRDNWRDGVVKEGESADQLLLQVPNIRKSGAVRTADIVAKMGYDERRHHLLALEIHQWLEDRNSRT